MECPDCDRQLNVTSISYHKNRLNIHCKCICSAEFSGTIVRIPKNDPPSKKIKEC